jgi:AcrR family transcriptional regulator
MGDTGRRTRLSRADRHAQLLDAARVLIREEGTDGFTLARLAERAGVTKPLAYQHFGDRAGVLAELYRSFEARQREVLAEALRTTPDDLGAVAAVVAAAYVDCCLAEGAELADVVAALAGSPTLKLVRDEAEAAYLVMLRDAVEPVAAPLDDAALQAVVGAGDAVARAAIAGTTTPARARAVLASVVVAVASGGPR